MQHPGSDDIIFLLGKYKRYSSARWSHNYSFYNHWLTIVIAYTGGERIDISAVPNCGLSYVMIHTIKALRKFHHKLTSRMNGNRGASSKKRPSCSKAVGDYADPSEKAFKSTNTDAMIKRIYDEIKIDTLVSQ